MTIAAENEALLREIFHKQTFMNTIGAEVSKVAHGLVEVTAPLGSDYLQHNGVGHAGLTFALGDTASGFAAATLFDTPTNVMTAEMKINLLRPAIGASLRASGTVIKAGKSLVVTQADVFAVSDDGAETHVAILIGTIAVAKPK